jgi:hypothetical protein
LYLQGPVTLTEGLWFNATGVSIYIDLSNKDVGLEFSIRSAPLRITLTNAYDKLKISNP